ncbi:thiol peroxidase [Ligilactobacillus equi]
MKVIAGGKEVSLVGNPPKIGQEMPHFKLTDAQGNRVKTRDFGGQLTLFSVIPDINTRVCSIQTKYFNQAMNQYATVRFVTVSTNTIAEQAAWCAAEGAENLEMMSDKEESFGYEMGLLIPQTGNLARSIYICDANKQIVYAQIVENQSDEPNYQAALAKLTELQAK